MNWRGAWLRRLNEAFPPNGGSQARVALRKAGLVSREGGRRTPFTLEEKAAMIFVCMWCAGRIMTYEEAGALAARSPGDLEQVRRALLQGTAVRLEYRREYGDRAYRTEMQARGIRRLIAEPAEEEVA